LSQQHGQCLTLFLFATDSHVAELRHLRALDVSDNNVCDFAALITLASALPALEFFSCSGNPCFPNNEPLLRINLISKLPCMRLLGAPLKLLNGFEISIDERVRSRPFACLCASVRSISHALFLS
jgi:Leucine-rich repeat (LRR) protein